jgi:nitrous oxidase accessory protein NosD
VACWLLTLLVGLACSPPHVIRDSQRIPLSGLAAPAALPSTCPVLLQHLVDIAEAGSVVSVPACTYRETVTITKPLTLQAQPGTEIRGSDVWTGWQQWGAYWVQGPLVPLPTHGICDAGTRRCLWPEQVFLDGVPLEQVAASPRPGQFAVDEARLVVLADDPTGRTVEVTVRTNWVRVRADDVTIRGFTMRHAGNPAQSGAIGNEGRSNFTLDGNRLSDAHGAVVSIGGGSGNSVVGNEISRGGQEGLQGWRSQDTLIQDNEIFQNNTERFSPDWEAGGIKLAEYRHVVLENNRVHHNNGPGIWCDGGCTQVTYANNRVYQNGGAGLFFEISNGAHILRNAVYDNEGAGIYISSSANAEVYENTLAWNGEGIFVHSQMRPDRFMNEVGVRDNYVHDNVIVAPTAKTRALRWATEFRDSLFDQASNNRGRRNQYWYPTPESITPRFGWDGDFRSLARFNGTPGEEGGRYLGDVEKDVLLTRAGIPLQPSRP